MTDYDEKLWWIALGAMLVGSATSKALKEKLSGVRPTKGDACTIYEALLRDDKPAVCKWLGLSEECAVIESVADKLKTSFAHRRAQEVMRQAEFTKVLPPSEVIKWLRERADELERVTK